LILNGAILGGMLKIAVVSTVAASVPAMALLGTIVIGCVGYSIYLNASYKKPTVDTI